MWQMSFLVYVVLGFLAAGVYNAQAESNTWDDAPKASTLPNILKDCNHWYTVKKGDTCYSIEQAFGISQKDFVKWNPDVSEDCTQNFWENYSYCVGVGPHSSTTAQMTSIIPATTSTVPTGSAPSSHRIPSSSGGVTSPGTYSIINPITSWNISTPTRETAWPPTKTQSGQPTSCYKWHEARIGESCDTLMSRYGSMISRDELLEWNPTLKTSCENLPIGYFYCVGAAFKSTSRFSYPTNRTEPFPTPFPDSSTTPRFTATTYPIIRTPSLTQSGIPSSCSEYHHATAGDTCSKILAENPDINEQNLHEWNPSLGKNCSGLMEGYDYCIDAFPGGIPPMPTVTVKPSPLLNGTEPNCKAWYKTKGITSCYFIANWAGTFSEQQFIAWNPDVGESCTNLKNDTWYCVADDHTPASRTAPWPSATPTPTSLSYPREPVNCNKWWHVGIGDTCSRIVIASGLNIHDFYAMNPDVSQKWQCDNLIPDKEVCIGLGDQASSSIHVSPTPSQSPSATTAIRTSPFGGERSTTYSTLTPSKSSGPPPSTRTSSFGSGKNSSTLNSSPNTPTSSEGRSSLHQTHTRSSLGAPSVSGGSTSPLKTVTTTTRTTLSFTPCPTGSEGTTLTRSGSPGASSGPGRTGVTTSTLNAPTGSDGSSSSHKTHTHSSSSASAPSGSGESGLTTTTLPGVPTKSEGSSSSTAAPSSTTYVTTMTHCPGSGGCQVTVTTITEECTTTTSTISAPYGGINPIGTHSTLPPSATSGGVSTIATTKSEETSSAHSTLPPSAPSGGVSTANPPGAHTGPGGSSPHTTLTILPPVTSTYVTTVTHCPASESSSPHITLTTTVTKECPTRIRSGSSPTASSNNPDSNDDEDDERDDEDDERDDQDDERDDEDDERDDEDDDERDDEDDERDDEDDERDDKDDE